MGTQRHCIWGSFLKLSLGIFTILIVWGWCKTSDAHAQTIGNCAVGWADAILDVGNVRARILNTGSLFGGGVNPSMYEVPKGSRVEPIFYASLWIGGFVQDTLRTAATLYRGNEFWPGPLGSQGQPPSDCTLYDRFAVLYRSDVEAYDRFGELRPGLEDWPSAWGAPVLDGDGNPKNYNLAGGDRPELLGDQTVWWVMNDAGNQHASSETKPLGLEVQGSAFAFNIQGAVGNATFYRYRLHYKGQHPLDSAYVALFLDTDLGTFSDDYIGSDTTLAMGYSYNADDHDEGGYGDAPPAVGLSFLQGPRASKDGIDNDRDGVVDEEGERLRATAVTYPNAGCCALSEPSTASDYYNYMQARWKDGTPFTLGGRGHDHSDQPISYVYPGDPVTGSFWSEIDTGEGISNVPADRMFTVASGPFDLEPGDVEEIVFAIVWSRGDSNLDSVRKLREDMAYVQSIAPELIAPRTTATTVDAVDRFALGYNHAYPNPFAEVTTIRYSLERAEHVRLSVYDVLGREVAMLVDEPQEPGWHKVVFDARDVSAGSYLYRLQVGRHAATETIVVVR